MANIGSWQPDRLDTIHYIHKLAEARAGEGYSVISGCDVHEKGTPDMNVVVDSGSVYFNNVITTVTGNNVTISAAHGTNDRIDVIYIDSSGVARVHTGNALPVSDPLGNTIWTQYESPYPKTGCPAGVIIALVYVPANDTSIKNAQIEDIAQYKASASAILDTLGSTATHVPVRGASVWGTNTLAALITALDNNVTQANGKYIATDKIRARDGDGLNLQDDDGNGVLIPAGGGMTFPAGTEDKISLFGNRLGLPNMYGFGVETGALYYKSMQTHRWYINANADEGTSSVMYLHGNNLWVAGNVSALSFTDRCKFPTGIDALAAIRPIKGDGKGELDHASLPDCVRVRTPKDIFEDRDVLDDNGKPKLDKTGQKITERIKVGEEIEEGRDLGAMVSVLTKAVQELEAIVKAQAAEITDLKKVAKGR